MCIRDRRNDGGRPYTGRYCLKSSIAGIVCQIESSAISLIFGELLRLNACAIFLLERREGFLSAKVVKAKKSKIQSIKQLRTKY